MSEDELRGLLELESRAAPGLWRIEDHPVTDDEPDWMNVHIKAPGYELPAHCYGRKYRRPNAALIAAARNALRPLVEEVLRLRAELERLYAAPVAEPVQPTTPGAREAAIEGELQRMLTKPRAITERTRMTPSLACPGCGSLAVFVQSENGGGTIHVCGNCWREW